MPPPQRNWAIGLAASLLVHCLLWYISNRIDISVFPPEDAAPSSISVMLVATPSTSPAAVVKPPEPPKPTSVPPKPKVMAPKPAITPKPVAKPKPVAEPEATRSLEDPAKTTQTSASPSTPSAAPTNPGPAAPAASSGHYEGPRINADYLHNPRPEYPHAAKRMGHEGRVLLRVQILPDGSAGSVAVSKSSGYETLDEAALEAVHKWKFVPAKRDGIPVESVVNVPINFNLKTE